MGTKPNCGVRLQDGKRPPQPCVFRLSEFDSAVESVRGTKILFAPHVSLSIEKLLRCFYLGKKLVAMATDRLWDAVTHAFLSWKAKARSKPRANGILS